MLTSPCVDRLLMFLKDRPDRKVKTAVYVSKTAELESLGHYIRQFLEDESYISRNGYKFDYEERDVFIEKTSTYETFKEVIAKNYEIVFMMEGSERDTLMKIVEAAASDDDTVFVPMDTRLKAYRLLDPYKQPRQLKRRQA